MKESLKRMKHHKIIIAMNEAIRLKIREILLLQKLLDYFIRC